MSQMQAAGLQIDVDVNPLVGVYRIGQRGCPSHVDVQVGRVGVLSHDGDVFGLGGVPEIYLAGETMRKSPFRRKAICIVAELAEYPGVVGVRATQPLAGISLTADDVARAEFRHHVRLEDPIKLLSRQAEWDRPDGKERLKRAVEDLIRSEVGAAFNDNLRLWSHPDIREVSTDLFAHLDHIVRAWGLRLEGGHGVLRKYPPALYEIALQFKAAERDLLDADAEAQPSHLHSLGLERADLLEIQNASSRKGGGAGLFLAARKRPTQVQSFIDWLALPEQGAPDAAGFLRNLYTSGYEAREIELSEQVLLAAFHSPVLGLGEWSESEEEPAEMPEYRQMEAFLDQPREEGA